MGWVWRIKMFNIIVVHWKIWFSGAGVHEKPIYTDLKIQGGHSESKWGGALLRGGVDTPMHTMARYQKYRKKNFVFIFFFGRSNNQCEAT